MCTRTIASIARLTAAALAVATAVSLPGCVTTVEPKKPDDRLANVQSVYRPFAGKWVGTLTYRDFSDNSMVTLPTQLTVSILPKQAGMIFDYIYDDGPGKTVTGQSWITIDPAAGTYTDVAQEGKIRDVYQVVGLAQFAQNERGMLMMTGPGEENGKKVFIKEVIEIDQTQLTMTRSSRLPGANFQMRHELKLQRETAVPQPAAAEPPAKK